MYIILAIATILRIIVAFWNINIGLIIGAEYDAQGFHEGALDISNEIYKPFYIGQSYMYFLGYMYKYTELNSQFFGSILSCIAWFLSGIMLIKVFDELKIEKLKLFAILIYAALPSSIAYSSITMRESYMLLIINTILLMSIYILKNNKIYFNILKLIILNIVLVLLNISFVTLSLFLLISFFIIKIVNNNSSRFLFINIFIVLLAYYLIIASPFFSEIRNYLIDFINTRQNHEQKFARASYQNGLILESNLSFVKFIIVSFVNYMSQPIGAKNLINIDYIVIVENLIRISMFSIAIIGFIKSLKNKNFIYLILFFSYLTIEITWACYTINWGTAVRHHLPSFGLLTLLSLYAINMDTETESQKK